MHEFSLALEVIDLARREVEKNKAGMIKEITIEVGDLSGVDSDAFESALGLLIKESILNRAKVNIVRVPGKGRCNSCAYDFEMNHRTATCPKCLCFPSQISGGDEFRVVSLLVE